MLLTIIQEAMSGGDITIAIISVLLSLPIIVIALSTHEAAHGFVAYKMGDHTAYNLGRITLNPIKHLDPLGFLCMLVVGYGWAKPVPINTRNFKNPKLGMALTGIAGPLANLLLGIIGSMLSVAVDTFGLALSPYYAENELAINIVVITSFFFQLFAFYNFILMAFNLIPIPPFDGSRFFLAFLPANVYFKIMKYERIIMIVILLIMIILPVSPFSWIANQLYSITCLPFGILFNLIVGLFI